MKKLLVTLAAVSLFIVPVINVQADTWIESSTMHFYQAGFTGSNSNGLHWTAYQVNATGHLVHAEIVLRGVGNRQSGPGYRRANAHRNDSYTAPHTHRGGSGN